MLKIFSFDNKIDIEVECIIFVSVHIEEKQNTF